MSVDRQAGRRKKLLLGLGAFPKTEPHHCSTRPRNRPEEHTTGLASQENRPLCVLDPGDRGRQRPLPKPITSRPPALHLQPYSSVSVWRGTEGGGVDAHRKRHLNQDYLTPSNKREGAYGCCLDLIASQNTSEIANFLTAPRSSSSVLFQRVCLAWD